MPVLKGKKLREYLNNVYYKTGNYTPKDHKSYHNKYLGEASYKKDSTNTAENYYNGHWDENYIDRYNSDN